MAVYMVIIVILLTTCIGLWAQLQKAVRDQEAEYYKGWSDCQGLAMSSAMRHGYDTVKTQRELFAADRIKMWNSLHRSK